ncbi:hypothetical protein [Pantoea sp. App145]|uniref:hypothetical protein n=1 Tax=Pantoea sp. App145 TaxID=3071567 RepID=UPI003A806E1C
MQTMREKKYISLIRCGLLMLALLTQSAMGENPPQDTMSLDRDIWINPGLPNGAITPLITSDMVFYTDEDLSQEDAYSARRPLSVLSSRELVSVSQIHDNLSALSQLIFLKTGELSGYLNPEHEDKINLMSDKYASKRLREGGYYATHIPVAYQLYNYNNQDSYPLLNYMKRNEIYDLPAGNKFFAGIFSAYFRFNDGFHYFESFPVLQGGTIHYVPTLINTTATGGNITGDVYLSADNSSPKGGYDLIKTPVSTTVTINFTGSDDPVGLQLSVEDKSLYGDYVVHSSKSRFLLQPSTGVYREVYETGTPGIGYRLTGKGGKDLSLKGDGVKIRMDTSEKSVTVPVELWFVATGDINPGTKALLDHFELGRLVLITGKGKNAVMQLAPEGSLTYSGKVDTSVPALGCDPGS